jgi:iron complex transport system substrate-binding protein
MIQPGGTARVALLLAVASLAALGGCGRSAPSAALPSKPGRIASLTLATDEMLAELVPADRMVCITQFADDPGISNVAGCYPKAIPRIREFRAERIIALAPDLVCVAPYNSADTLELLKRSGLSTYSNESVRTIDEIEAGLAALGQRVGEPQHASILIERMRSRRRRLADRLIGVPRRPRVLFWSAGYTAGRDSTIDQVITEAGGENVATSLQLEGSAEISPERVIGADPDVILLASWKADDRQGQIMNHPILRKLRAVQEGRVVEIESRYLTSVSQHVVEGAERLARALHPDRFPVEKQP